MISIIRPSVDSDDSEEDRMRNIIPLGGNIVRIIRIKPISVDIEKDNEVNNMSDDENNFDEPEDEYEEDDDLDSIPDEDDELDELPDVNFDELSDDFEEDEEEDFEGLDDDL